MEGRTATTEEIIEEGRKIWDAVLKADIDRSDEKGSEKLLKEIRDKYPDFAYSLPFVLKWIVLMKDYDPKAFKKYVNWYVKYKASTKERINFVKNQSKYLVFLFKARYPRSTPVVLRKFQDEINEKLEEEDKEFKEMAESAKKEIEDMKDEYDDLNREELYELVRKLKEEKDHPQAPTES